ncbi:unnamed protein product [Phytomonas sp. Hart1]|nr:unnamed protein product [Phytomonas sp. Hart1]|eukprot:CCW67827.1 unnamed protein product [Phytomonas sp. isolate Hart1]
MSQTVRRMNLSDFKLEKQIGSGAFSKVVIGLHLPTDVYYAVKLISKRTILNAPTEEERIKMAEAARRESRMLLMCVHPNIVRFFGSMQSPEDLVYITELCEGGELLDAIKRLHRIPLEASRHAIAELFSAVFYLHYGEKKNLFLPGAPVKPITVLHRDIKPENVMLSSNMHVKLIDFGTTVVCESVNDRPEGEKSGGERAQTFCGTSYYMSPELLQDNYTCCASDYWGCGCVLYHMLVGKRPFDAPTQYLLIRAVIEQEPEYPENLDPLAKDLIKKLLIKSPEKRISMHEIKAHPFFSTVGFNNLTMANVENLWVKETPWVDVISVLNCANCKRVFFPFSRKDYCRLCGNYFCLWCLPEKRVLVGFRHHCPQLVCSLCSKKLNRL